MWQPPCWGRSRYDAEKSNHRNNHQSKHHHLPSKSGSVWYGRFRIKNPELAEGKRTITETLKTLDKDDAINDFLDNYKRRMDARGDAKHRKGNFTPTMYRHYRKTIQRYWLEYFPDLELKLVKYETFDDYEMWRRTYFQREKFHIQVPRGRLPTRQSKWK